MNDKVSRMNYQQVRTTKSISIQRQEILRLLQEGEPMTCNDLNNHINGGSLRKLLNVRCIISQLRKENKVMPIGPKRERWIVYASGEKRKYYENRWTIVTPKQGLLWDNWEDVK